MSVATTAIVAATNRVMHPVYATASNTSVVKTGKKRAAK